MYARTDWESLNSVAMPRNKRGELHTPGKFNRRRQYRANRAKPNLNGSDLKREHDLLLARQGEAFRLVLGDLLAHGPVNMPEVYA